jgi:predicted nucleic acid-binding Zn ribbon protein
MIDALPTTNHCWSCGAAVDPHDRFCRRCGQAQERFVAWYYRPFWIVVLSLTVLGPFALPLIWRTPQLGRRGKWVASLALIGLCAWIGWGFVVEVRRFFDQYQAGDELLSL